jgi:hypothetical protein
MSQQLTPYNGGVQQVQTSVTTPQLQVLSPQSIKVRNLESRPTEWVPGGRPIYRRLPAVSETYQVDFFADGEIGYVYIPWGLPSEGSGSVSVSATSNNKELLISNGTLVWKYGNNPVNTTLLDMQELGVTSGRYLLAYQLVYDDQISIFQYSVENFSLIGQPLNLNSGSVDIPGWKNIEENAFLNNPDLYWSSYDSTFTSYPQPASAYLQWESPNPGAYTSVKLYQPAGFPAEYTAQATLEIMSEGTWQFAANAELGSENNQVTYTFNLSNPSFVRGWRVVWTSIFGSTVPKVYIQNVEVSGIVSLPSRPSGPETFASLVLYPENLVPDTVTGANGKELTAVYANLAFVEVNSVYEIITIEDARYIIHRNYTPVADWLTTFWDNNLTNLYDQVKTYQVSWMNPQVCLNQEYVALAQYGILPEGTLPLTNIIT